MVIEVTENVTSEPPEATVMAALVALIGSITK